MNTQTNVPDAPLGVGLLVVGAALAAGWKLYKYTKSLDKDDLKRREEAKERDRGRGES